LLPCAVELVIWLRGVARARPNPLTLQDLFRLSVEQYHQLIDIGVITDDDNVELIEGLLVTKTGKKEPHSTATRKIRRAIDALLPSTLYYDSQEPLRLEDGEPEPDGMVLFGTIEDFLDAHPTPADTLLVIEVADTTLDRDRSIKLRSYARGGVRQYWIVNLVDRQIEVYTDPDANAVEPTYRSRRDFKAGDSLPLSLGENVRVDVAASDLLP
jgi:Uma2 family endonuclease